MLSNEVFALACRAYYNEIGLTVDETNGEFAHSPLTRKECDTGYYLLHGHHQHQGLLQSRDLNKCCFFPGNAKRWLEECDYWPNDYFDLWGIYEEFKGENARKLHTEENGEGKSLRGIESAERMHSVKTLDGRSLHGVKAAERLNQEKDEEGRSLNSLKCHREKNEKGKSIHALNTIVKIHDVKNKEGKSLQGIKNGKRMHSAKNNEGKSINAVKGATQVWESTIDGFRSNAGNVVKHNRANGWDPNARLRVK